LLKASKQSIPVQRKESVERIIAECAINHKHPEVGCCLSLLVEAPRTRLA
jgi:hypothetical protein